MAVVSRGHVYVHVPKCSGTYTHVAMGEAGAVRYHPHHGPASELPSDVREDRRVFAAVRDPWTWYGSLHAWLERRGGHFQGFADIEPWEWGEIPTRDGLPLYTWTVRRMLMDDAGAWAVDMLVAADRIEQAHRALGLPAPGGHANVNPAGSRYRELYTDELEAAVLEADGWIADLFGWKPWHASRFAVLPLVG